MLYLDYSVNPVRTVGRMYQLTVLYSMVYLDWSVSPVMTVGRMNQPPACFSPSSNLCTTYQRVYIIVNQIYVCTLPIYSIEVLRYCTIDF